MHVDGIVGSHIEVLIREEVDEQTKRKIETHTLQLLLALSEFINDKMIVERLNDMPQYLRNSYEFLMETDICDLAIKDAAELAIYAKGYGFFYLAISSLILEEIYKRYFASVSDRIVVSNIRKALTNIENGCRLAGLYEEYLEAKHRISNIMRQLPDTESLTSKHVERVLKGLLEILFREATIERVSHVEYGKYIVYLSMRH